MKPPTKHPAAVALGTLGGLVGGKSTSPAKRAAGARNGHAGGRPTKVVALAREWWQGLSAHARAAKGDCGYVIVVGGEIDGWSRSLDNPCRCIPGCHAVPVVGGHILVGVGGGPSGGAVSWEQTVDRSPDLREPRRLTANWTDAQRAAALSDAITPRGICPQYLRDLALELPEMTSPVKIAETCQALRESADRLESAQVSGERPVSRPTGVPDIAHRGGRVSTQYLRELAAQAPWYKYAFELAAVQRALTQAADELERWRAGK